MADPLTAFGAAAGAVQIADVALRASGEAYGFLAAVKDAGKDVQALRDTLCGVESNIRSLRNYVSKFSKSKNAREEFEVLPEAITGTLMRFHDDMVYLKSVLPRKPSPTLAQKVRWAYNRHRVASAIKRLNDRKTDLNIALAITGRQHDLNLRQDTAELSATLVRTKDKIMGQQELYRSAISGQTASINEHVGKYERDHAELVHHVLQVKNRVNDVQASLDQRHASAHEPTASDHVRARVMMAIHENENAFTTSGFGVPHEASRSPQTTHAMQADLLDIRSTTTISASSTDVLTKIFRSELRSNLMAIIEQTFEICEARRESRLSRIEAMVDQISTDLGGYILALHHSRESESSSRNSPQFHGQQLASMVPTDPGLSKSRRKVNGNCPLAQVATPGRPVDMLTTLRRSWFTKWRIGSVQIEIESRIHRKYGSPKCDSSTSIYIHFRPSQAWIRLPGLSILSSVPSYQGGILQFAPIIATFPIISWPHPVFDAITEGNVQEVQRLLESGVIHPRSQSEAGDTLLHRAALFAKPELCKLLLAYGLTWDQTDRVGYTPVRAAASSIFLSSRLHSPSTLQDADTIQTLELIAESGVDLGDVCGDLLSTTQRLRLDETWIGRWQRYFECMNYLITRHSIDAWQLHFTYWDSVWWLPTEINVENLSGALGAGLDPNLLLLGPMRRLLVQAMYGMRWLKAYKKNEDERSRISEIKINAERTLSGPEVSAPLAHQLEDLTVPWSLVKLLIAAGADIYSFNPKYFDRAPSWHYLYTPCGYAYVWGIEKEWETALRECGLDPDGVYRENVRRLREAHRLHGAKRSGIDESVLELPFPDGLRCRPCHRKRCLRKHGYWLFERPLHGT